jgi:hypothetical protein
MRGLGAYAQGIGGYEVQDAQARSINVDTIRKWNQVLLERQRVLRQQQAQAQARQDAERQARVQTLSLEDGSQLNALLDQLLTNSLSTIRPSASKIPLTGAVIRDIPFASETEALTICLDQMTGRDLPDVLMDPMYRPERDALRSAVEAALKEDRAGDVSDATKRRLLEAIARFRDRYVKDGQAVGAVSSPGLDYFNAVAALVPMLKDPGMKAILNRLEDAHGATVGDLIAFMNAYNLRFGPATTGRQVQVYRDLLPLLAGVRDSVASDTTPSAPDRTGEGLRNAAQSTFKGMDWNQIQAQAKSQ